MDEDIIPNEKSNYIKVFVAVFLCALVLLAVFMILEYNGYTDRNYFTDGRISFENGDYETSIEFLKKAAHNEPENSEIKALLARALVKNAQTKEGGLTREEKKLLYEESIEYFDVISGLEYTEGSIEHEELLLSKGLAFWNVEQYEKADEIFLNLIKISPNLQPVARVFLADDYTKRFNKPEEALAVLDPALNTTDQDLLLWAFIIKTRLSTYFGSYSDTKKYANLIIETAGQNNADALNYAYAYTHLAEVEADRGNLTLAKEWITKANDVMNEEGLYSCYLADIYYRSKNFELALVATMNRPNDPLCWYVISKTSFDTKDFKNARIFAQKALEAHSELSFRDMYIERGIPILQDILENSPN